MTPREDLETLAAKVEAAEGADRELDALIAAAIAGITIRWRGNDLLGTHPVSGDTVMLGWIDPGETNRWFKAAYPPPPAYTASLDAAMTLLDDHKQYDPDQLRFAPSVLRRHDGTGSADVHISPYGDLACAQGATPALALCAAALRARASALTGYGEKGE